MSKFSRQLSVLFKDYLSYNTSRGASKFIKNIKKTSPRDGSRDAAVLCCLKEEKDGIQVLLNIRSSNLSRSPGDVCFPGGMVDPTDNSLEDAALREAEEEVNLKREQVDVISTLPPSIWGGNRNMIKCHAVICTIRDTKNLNLQPNPEVQDMFWMPLETFLSDNGEMHEQMVVMYREEVPMELDYFNIPRAGDHVLWGLTARLCITIATIVYSRHPSFTHTHYYISSNDADSFGISEYFLPLAAAAAN